MSCSAVVCACMFVHVVHDAHVSAVFMQRGHMLCIPCKRRHAFLVMSLVDDPTLSRIHTHLTRLNPAAPILITTRAHVALHDIIGIRAFDGGEIQRAVGKAQEE